MMRQAPSPRGLLLLLFSVFLLALSLTVVVVVQAQTTETWTGCVSDPANPNADRVKIGQPTTICLQVGNGVDWTAANATNYIRLSFTPKADAYSRFHIPNSYSDLITGSASQPTIWSGKQVAVGVSSQQGLSFLRIYYDPSLGRVYPYLTAIINVKDGVVTGITWDDGCVFCNNNLCNEITYNYNGIQQTQATSGQPTGGCYMEKQTCDEGSGTSKSTQCDLLLYVVWTGSDVEGRALLSSANRFSAFPTQEIQNRLWNNLPEFSVPGIN